MAEIYTNFSFDNFELNSENFTETLIDYAKKLESTAKEFKAFAKFIKSKKIKIADTKGFAYAGSFEVDEIDAARLETAGLVIDLNKNLPDDPIKLPSFYIDEELDDVIKKLDEQDILEFDGTVADPNKSTQEILANIKSSDIEDQTSVLNLVELMQGLDTPEQVESHDDEFQLGSLGLSIKNLGDHQYSFNLTVADINKDPSNIKFDRAKGIFEYKCDSCDDIHTESIVSVYRSLKTTNALLSNLIALISDKKELAITLDFIDHDLRLLQHLLALDYALNEKEGVVEDNDEDCDHEDDEDDNEIDLDGEIDLEEDED